MERRVVKVERPGKGLVEWAVGLAVANTSRWSRSRLLRSSKARSLGNRKNNYIVCFVGDKPVGFATLRFSRDTAYVLELHVEEGHRSQGIGTQLLDRCRREHEDVVRQVVLYVYKENLRGIEFYRRNGFEINEGYGCDVFHELVLSR